MALLLPQADDRQIRLRQFLRRDGVQQRRRVGTGDDDPLFAQHVALEGPAIFQRLPAQIPPLLQLRIPG